MNDIDARIRDALRAAADEVREQDLRPQAPPWSARVVGHRMNRWMAPMLAAAAVIAIVATSVALSGSPTASRHVPPAGNSPVGSQAPTLAHTGSPPPVRTSVQASRAARSRIAPPVSEPSAMSQPPTPTDTRSPSPARTSARASRGQAQAACFFADACPSGGQTFYEPLWPFPDYAQAWHWETVDGPNGHAPWHLDATATALSFAEGFLQFSDVTTVTTAQVGVDQAHVGVGYRDDNGTEHTSAVLHLVRYERSLGDSNAAWEIVGSDDTTLSIERPAYGTTVTSPLTIGGHITGVDENIQVAVRSFDDRVVGRAAPLPTGGTNRFWSVSVPFTGHGTLTIVASTGGHLIQHERFAIHGVHTSA